MREYFKKYKGSLIITSVLNLLPIGAGLILWDKLPEKMPIHWGVNGEVDNWASRPVAVFVMPLILFAAQWLCFLLSGLDPKRRNLNPKVLSIVLGIIPGINLAIHAGLYLYALGYEVDMVPIICALVGVLFIIIGNYLPKCKQSYTMGIKLPWTLHDEENWNATHRLAGKLWVVGGVLTIGCGFLPPVAAFIVLMSVVVVMVAVPTVYSYRYYKKHKSEE